MGKLSEADWRALDRELRAQAIEILKQLDELEGPRTCAADGFISMRSQRHSRSSSP